MMTSERFKCPKCGGSSFGSTLDSPMGPMHRYCHGNDAGGMADGCTFNWPDSEDWKYFLVDGVKLSQEDHKAFRDKIRSIRLKGE